MRPLAVIDGLLNFFPPDDPVEGEETSLQPTEETSSLGVYFNLLFFDLVEH